MIKLSINLSKKIPGAVEYSSIQASCSLESEIAHGADPVAEAALLYRQAEEAVDQQLGINGVKQPASTPAPSTSANTAPQSLPPSARTSRRGPAPCTDSQIRLVERLLTTRPDQRQAQLSRFNVADVHSLSCKQASELIDLLKSVPR